MNGMSTPELLKELNVDRLARGLSPLKSWKASRGKLIEAVDKTRAAGVANEADDVVASDGDVPTIADKTELKRARKVTSKIERVAGVGRGAKQAKSTDKRPQLLSDFGDYLRKHGINPKVARAKLRRHGLAGPYTLTAQVKKLLSEK